MPTHEPSGVATPPESPDGARTVGEKQSEVEVAECFLNRHAAILVSGPRAGLTGRARSGDSNIDMLMSAGGFIGVLRCHCDIGIGYVSVQSPDKPTSHSDYEAMGKDYVAKSSATVR